MTTHLFPTPGSARTRCCRAPMWQLHPNDRLTDTAALATCRGRPPAARQPRPLAKAALAALRAALTRH